MQAADTPVAPPSRASLRGTAPLDQRHGGRDARLLGGAPHLLQLLDRRAERLLDDERDAPLDQRPARLRHLVVRAENVRELDVRQLQQPAPVGFHRATPQLGKVAHPIRVLVRKPDDAVHLGDRRGIQRDVPVRGAEHDGAGAAHDDPDTSVRRPALIASPLALAVSACTRPTRGTPDRADRAVPLTCAAGEFTALRSLHEIDC